MYDPHPAAGAPSSAAASAAASHKLLESLTVASGAAAAAWLAHNPVDMSWEGATDELLRHYDRAIEANMPYRREKSSNKASERAHAQRHLSARAALARLATRVLTRRARAPRRADLRQLAVLHSLLALLWSVGLWWLMRAYSRYLIVLFARLMLLDIHIRN